MTAPSEHALSTNVGFIGLGRMGAPMACSLLRAGYAVTVYNRTRERAQQLRNGGAAIAPSPADVARTCEVVITMLTDGAAVAEVCDGPHGVFAGASAGSVVVEMSTIGPDAVRALAERARRGGVALLDAPVSGSVASARTGTLLTVVGGDREAFERVRPVLAAMTATQVWVGGSGSGAAMKLALNGMIAVTNEALSEALVFAERSGIPRELAYDAIWGSAVGSPFVGYKRAAFLTPDEEPVAFSVAMMRKDLSLHLSLARRLGVRTPAVEAAEAELTTTARTQGDDADLASVAVALRQAGLEAA